MKVNKIKALVGALALTASGYAAADIAPAAIGSPGELVFWAYGQDASGAFATYVKDLGITYDAFVSSPGYALTNLGADANWNSFLNDSSLVGDKNWAVTALATQGGVAANSRKILTTFNLDTPVGNTTNGPMTTAYGNFLTATNALNVIDGSGAAANNSFYLDTTTSGLDRNLGFKLGASYGTSDVFPNVTNVIGTTTNANFFQVIKTSTNGGLAATVGDIDAADAYWTLSGNNLSYSVAAIPEPETYGMLAAGLLMLGAVVRRRRAQ